MDLADQIDDYICSFEGLGDLTMDSLAMFIFLWAVLALFSVWLCKLLYHKYLNKGATNPASASNSRQSSVAPGSGSTSSTKTEKRLSEPRDLLATKSKVDDLSKTPAGGAIGGSAGRGRSTASPIGGAGAGAAAGPRRRVVRQSSTGPENRKKRYVPPPSNVVGPETVSETGGMHMPCTHLFFIPYRVPSPGRAKCSAGSIAIWSLSTSCSCPG